MSRGNTVSHWPIWMKPGIRVVRGPDWKQTIRDASAVDLGTLSYVPKQAADNKVNVVWDTGLERSYKSGYSGQYELRAYDIQQVGITHPNKNCSECKKVPIRGIRYHCIECKIDMCTKCYMADAHNLAHCFQRFDTDKAHQVNLPARNSSQKYKLKGVFEKSEVIRGPHWNYPNRDGGDTNKGTVMAFIEEKDGVANGWVRVKWDIGNEVAEYRLGAGGYVDIVASKTSVGGTVYVEHLPLVGIIKLKNGDKVNVNMELKTFKGAQEKANVPGGWNDGMKQCIKETGTVQELLYNGEMARVQYQDGNMHVITIAALYRKSGFQRGGAVQIIKDVKKLKKLQEGHGGYSQNMNQACGKLGRILNIHDDGDMLILAENRRFLFSPAVCEPVNDPNEEKKAPAMPDSDSEDDTDNKEEPSGATAIPSYDSVPGRTLPKSKDQQQLAVFSQKMGSYVTSVMKNQDTDIGKKMFDALNQADLKAVKDIIEKNKALVNNKVEGRTILHMACHEGYKDLVRFLIDHGASMEELDDEGDTPLHYAAFGKQPDCIQELLQNASDPNVLNKAGITPLIIAVNHPCIDSVQCLILNNANVSIRNNDGDTALHDAVEQKDCQPVISTIVLGSNTANFTVLNSKNFNVLQWATIKDNRGAVKMMLEKDSAMVDLQLDGGFTALHIAAANDFVEITSLLLDLGHANPNSKDAEGRTPLHIAVAQSHKRIIEVLVDKKADVNAQDKAGDTSLHYSQKKPNLSRTRRVNAASPDVNIQIVYFLLEKGADIYKKNNEGHTPMDFVVDPNMKAMIERLTAAYKTAPAKSQRGVRLPIHWKDMSVTEMEMVTLDTTDTMQKQEYQEVEKHFINTLSQSKVEFIKRIQNPLLWEHYTLDFLYFQESGSKSSAADLLQMVMRKKRELEKKYGQGCANELHLYHGTKPEIIEVIANDNFDFRIAGSRVGALYGDGTYFATTAKYSDLYASSDNDGLKVMFLAKVLAGRIAIGKPGMKRPPEVDPNNYKKGMYDSVVNNVTNPTIYCVFDKNQYYPEYLIMYR